MPARPTHPHAQPRSRSANRCRLPAASSGVSTRAERACSAPLSTDARRRPATQSARASIGKPALPTSSASPSTAMRSRRRATCDRALLASPETRATATRAECRTSASNRAVRQCRATRSRKRGARSRKLVTSSRTRRDAGRRDRPSSESLVLSSRAANAAAASPAEGSVTGSARPTHSASATRYVLA